MADDQPKWAVRLERKVDNLADSVRSAARRSLEAVNAVNALREEFGSRLDAIERYLGFNERKH